MRSRWRSAWILTASIGLSLALPACGTAKRDVGAVVETPAPEIPPPPPELTGPKPAADFRTRLLTFFGISPAQLTELLSQREAASTTPPASGKF